ncbi:MAG TPA: response regulator transcription factor [Gaiellaceae bacterium]|nr:response regulator transcription factor [Gaiellaceae bacterium]
MNPLTALRLTADEQTQPSLRVLVVDDQLLYAEAISVLLGQQDGMGVVGIASDGREAIEQAVALRPDVVLMDIRMPRLDGISATRRIRRRLPGTRVVVMTGLTGDEHVERALGAGADACIKKFSRAGDLVTAIEHSSEAHRGRATPPVRVALASSESARAGARGSPRSRR